MIFRHLHNLIFFNIYLNTYIISALVYSYIFNMHDSIHRTRYNPKIKTKNSYNPATHSRSPYPLNTGIYFLYSLSRLENVIQVGI